MTPNELTDLICLELGAVNDFVFKKAMLARANLTRNQQLKRSLEKKPQDRKFFTQRILVPMENYNAFSGTELSCTWSRSKCTTPRPLRANSIVYDYVGSVDGFRAFRQTQEGTSKYITAHPHANHTYPFRYEEDKFVVEHAGIDKILAVGIFADPEEAYNIDAKTRECTSCDFWESQYPCSEDVLDIVIQEITGKWRTKPVNLEVNGTQNRPDPSS
jgi:hypothetical protein